MADNTSGQEQVQERSYKSLVEGVRALPSFSVYKNSSIVSNPGHPLTVEDVVKAGLIANLNILLLGERGEGKTQLMQDTNNAFFSGNGVYIRARPDMKVRDLYEKFNITNLERELSDITSRPFTQIDEINRAPPIVQNEFFHICDGYIEFQGKKVELGGELGYHTTMASANIGNGGYVGTFEMDDAILDRFHLILNIDNYPTKVNDDVLILSNTSGRNPRVINHSERKDNLKELADLSAGLGSITRDFSADAALLYLRKGFDYCLPDRSNGRESKRAVLQVIPEICKGCHRLGDGCGYIRPISTRATKAISALAPALKLVADAKSNEDISDDPSENERRGLGVVSYKEILEAFKIVAPYADIVDSSWVRTQYKSNPNFAVDEVAEKLRRDIDTRKNVLEVSFRKSLEGKLGNQLNDFKEDWSFYATFLREINTIAAQEGNLNEVEDIPALAEKYPLLNILRK
ncbi:MAG TPA: AAA domain-containing protein [Nanoarchaeota archaeon]|nr:AAA family ATPase [Candidatus Pacearchaeota archaeon]HIH17887.1 AAA domain-containing protein [Nanoarchaeota archaeon]HIH33743.1 AAA domain-containing protein [Nanoarchaeota archaeon]HIH51328.1 AAA domain-containing protein [Nanoarchaeota archaeon]HIH65624.1 AAA domain-containing protein [Nanoarchaeota archaeon]